MTGVAQLTPSKLAVQLVEGSLAHIAGRPHALPSIVPVEVTELERSSVGLSGGGQTMMYPLGPVGVFIDLSGSVATIWFVGGDFDRGLDEFESMLKSQRAKRLKDEASPETRQRVRSYEVDLGGGRLAHVVVEYAERGAARERFVVRVGAQVRRN
ncbi:MAG: hypothetical protein IT547_04680 [Hyphomonadaceae bacterium]|nr:hypothetical protein [Hyphomonadaceae bacterium]